MIRATTRGRGRAFLLTAIDTRQPFRTGGALRGDDRSTCTSSVQSGRLDGDDYIRFIQDSPEITYWVTSYNTPIYWVTTDGTAYRVKQKFSATTSKHQGACPRGDNEPTPTNH